MFTKTNFKETCLPGSLEKVQIQDPTEADHAGQLEFSLNDCLERSPRDT